MTTTRFSRVAAVAAVCALAACAAAGARSPGTPPPREALRAIQANARAIQRDAKVYQWTRMNKQVARIIAEERTVQKALAPDAHRRGQAGRLKRAVLALRAAGFARDASRSVQAAQLVSSACTALAEEPGTRE